MSTQLATQQSVDDALIAIVRDMPAAQQLSWLQLARAKDDTKAQMEKKELEAQQLLINFMDLELLPLQNAIKAYEAIDAELPDVRKGFTRYLNIIERQLMVIEKRVSGYTYTEDGKLAPIADHILANARARFLKLREDNEKDIAARNARASELTKFKVFVQNEYVRIASEYKIALGKQITESYTQALNDIELTDDGLKQYVTLTEKCLREVKVCEPKKFAFELHDKTKQQDLNQILKIVDENPAPNYAVHLKQAVDAMRDKFSMYFQDRANKEKATAFIQQQQRSLEAEVNEQQQTTSAVNNLTANSAVIIEDTSGVIPIKSKSVIVVKDNDPAWAQRVVTEFLSRWATCAQRVKVSKWGNLTVKQMAAALQEEDEMINGLQYEEIKK